MKEFSGYSTSTPKGVKMTWRQMVDDGIRIAFIIFILMNAIYMFFVFKSILDVQPVNIIEKSNS